MQTEMAGLPSSFMGLYFSCHHAFAGALFLRYTSLLLALADLGAVLPLFDCNSWIGNVRAMHFCFCLR